MCVKMHFAAKSDDCYIEREGQALKDLSRKDLSTTIAANISSTGAAAITSISVTEL